MRRPSHTPPRGAIEARSAGPSGMATLTPEARAAIQTLLFDNEPERTLGDALDRYRAEVLDLGELAPRTVEWRARAVTRCGDWRSRSVRAKYRDAAIELYKRHGQAVGSQCVNTLGRVLILSRKWGWRYDEHDLQGLARIRSSQRTEIVSADDRPALLAALRSMPSARRAVAADVARLLLLTGMRLHEATSIEWVNVARKDRYLVLPKTKNGKPRIVPLVDEALAIIEAQPRSGRWVFAGRRGRHIDDGLVGHALNIACEASGVPHTTPHVLRHTFATEAMRAGIPDEVAAKALGHTSLTELRRYQHARVEDVRGAMEIVARAVGGDK